MNLRRAIGLAIAILMLAPSGAWAGTEFVRDARRDVVWLHWTCGDGTGCHSERTVARKHRIGDIVWTRRAYRERRLVLSMKVRGMTRRTGRATYIGWDIRQANGVYVDAQILYHGGSVDLDVAASTDGFRCPGARVRIRPKRHVYVVKIPVTCLNRTRWVRVSAATLVTGNINNSWFDVAGLGSDIKLTAQVPETNFGRRIHRGTPQP